MKRRGKVMERFILMASMAAGLCGMGSVYASWTNRLETSMHLDTDQFCMRVPDDVPALVSILDADGEVQNESEMELETEEEGKLAHIRLTDSILAGLLADGGAVRVEFPLVCAEEESVWEIGSSMQESTAELKPEQILLVSGGACYELPDPFAEAFEDPVPCSIQAESEMREDGAYGMITLTVDAAAQEELAGRPDTLVMTEEELGALVPVSSELMDISFDTEVSDGESIGSDMGVAVIYSVSCDLYLGQAGEVTEE